LIHFGNKLRESEFYFNLDERDSWVIQKKIE